MPIHGFPFFNLFLFIAVFLSATDALACPEGQIQMDECFCYKLLPDSLLKRETGGSQSFELDASAPPTPAPGAPAYCTSTGNEPPPPKTSEKIISATESSAPIAPIEAPMAPAPSAPEPQACMLGYRPVGACDCVENKNENPKIKPRPGAPPICAQIETSRKSTSGGNQTLPSARGDKPAKSDGSMPLVHCEWFHIEPGNCRCAHRPREPGAVLASPTNLQRCADEYARGRNGKGFEHMETPPPSHTGTTFFKPPANGGEK